MFGPAGFLFHLLGPLGALIVVVVLLAGGVWGLFWGPLRRSWLRVRVATRRLGLGRAQGALYCPECASALRAGPPEHPLAHHLCPRCSGKWFTAAALEAALARKGKPAPPWHLPRMRLDPLSCPSCLRRMPAGFFENRDFPVGCCSACGGYWAGRIEWVSLELNVLG